jgi:hypothetical protein
LLIVRRMRHRGHGTINIGHWVELVAGEVDMSIS